MALLGLALNNTLRYFHILGQAQNNTNEILELFQKNLTCLGHLGNDQIRQILSGESFKEYEKCNELIKRNALSLKSLSIRRSLNRRNLTFHCLICFSSRATHGQLSCGHDNYCETCYSEHVEFLSVQMCPKCSRITNKKIDKNINKTDQQAIAFH